MRKTPKREGERGGGELGFKYSFWIQQIQAQ